MGKLGSTSSPPIQNTGSWGSGKRPLITSSELPHHLYRIRPRGEARVNFLTTYIERGLVGKLGSTSSPPIQKEVSWGSSGQLPHHLYKRRARGEAGKRPQLTSLSSPPPIQKRGSWGSSGQLPHHLYKRRARGEVLPRLPHHLWRRTARGEVGFRIRLFAANVYAAHLPLLVCLSATHSLW